MLPASLLHLKWVGTKPGLWTLDWIMDLILDLIGQSIDLLFDFKCWIGQ